MAPRHICHSAAFACVVILLSACGGRNRAADKILADETFFKKGVIPVVSEAREACKKNLEQTFAPEKLAPGTQLDKVSTSVSVNIPTNLQPNIAAIEGKYGKPDRVEQDTHFYGETGFRVGKQAQEGKVVEIVAQCTLKNIKAKK
jgi:hypothetical protein